MEKHTPGPWKVKELGFDDSKKWVVLWTDKSKKAIRERRVDVFGEFMEGDAKLISAAPDLLAALKKALEQLIPYSDEYAEATAAIAKATSA